VSNAAQNGVVASDEQDRIAELEQQVEALRARNDALSRKLDTLVDIIIGEERELHEPSIEARDALLQTIDDVATDATAARQEAEGASAAVESVSERVQESSKQARIDAEVRDHLVKKALLGTASRDARKLALADVDDITPADLDVSWQEAKRCRDRLVTEWAAFVAVETGDDQQAIGVSKSRITTDLANTCGRSLGRDDLANTVVGERREGVGGS